MAFTDEGGAPMRNGPYTAEAKHDLGIIVLTPIIKIL